MRCLAVRKHQSCELNPILDWVQDTPIMDGGGKKPPPKFNSAIWRLTTMKLGRNRVIGQELFKTTKISDVISTV